MTFEQTLFALLTSIILASIVYHFTGWKDEINCYKLWFRKDYWTNYNVIEAVAWFAKAIIIIPGLIFGVQLWQLYIASLITSMSLIWASNKKLLPTLVGFNTLWIWLSMMVIAQKMFPG